MNNIIIGNLIAIIASGLMIYTGILKEKKKIIYVQTIQIGLLVLSNLVLGGITGAIINIISCIRNILCYKEKLGLKEKILITIVSVLLSIYFNDMGVIGLLPVLATTLYIWLMNTKNVIHLKMLLMVTSSIWLVYDLFINLYVSVIFEFTNIIVNFISIIQIKRKKNNDIKK